MMTFQKSALLVMLATSLAPVSAKDLSVVPYPYQVNQINDQPGASFCLKDGFTVSTPREFGDAAKLFIEDAARLYSIEGKLKKADASITLRKDESLKGEAYKVDVTPAGVVVKGSNYKAVVMGLTTVLQMLDKKTHALPSCSILDAPHFEYRCLMLDVARQWCEFETIRHMVDLCRWYKLPYLQLHLSDDQLWTFESKKFPKLMEGRQYYTQEQLRELVEYAKKRGVAIVPEMDLPGHSMALRWSMPEVFGKDGSVIDIVNPECIKAVKTIMKEMMDVFYTSPYFHIGADEVNFSGYDSQPHVVEFLEKNKDKYDGCHDLLNGFIVDMNEFIKKNGKKTIVWEGFHGTGSAKQPIPKDIMVLVWETLFNHPRDLIANGYDIVNNSFKPTYTTPERRFSPEYIYRWNPRRWERYRPMGWGRIWPQIVEFTPESEKHLKGLQMSSWEGIDHEHLLTLKDRVAAVSEHGWNDQRKMDFEDYAPRAKEVDAKVMDLIFPAKATLIGFEEPCKYGMDYNKPNEFRREASAFYEPFNPDYYITYTTDGSLPGPESTKMIEPLKLTGNMMVKYHMYDKAGHLQAYKTCNYKMRPLEFFHENFEQEWDRAIVRDVVRREFSGENATVRLVNHVPGTTVHYCKGKYPTMEDPIYDGGSIPVKESIDFWAACFDKDGKMIGSPYNAHYNKMSPEQIDRPIPAALQDSQK